MTKHEGAGTNIAASVPHAAYSAMCNGCLTVTGAQHAPAFEKYLRSRTKRTLLLGLFLVITLPVQGQVLRGLVSDAESGITLPNAHVIVANTFRGTITNNDGAFELRVDSLPVTLIVRFIGYRTDTLSVTTDVFLDVRLEPVAIELAAITVTGEDPAVQIMREVIERKKEWRAALESYSAQAYARTTMSNDSGIVAIIEGASTAWWHRDRGMREIKRGSRQTGNIEFGDYLPVAAMALNLYDDNIQTAGHRLIGVTHPDALSKYNFTLIGERRLDEAKVYDIAVEPKNDLIVGFTGRVSVLGEVYAMIDVDLRPGKAFLHPQPIQRFEVSWQQQYSNYGTNAWLPADLRSSSVLDFGFGPVFSLPTIYIGLINRFSDYQLNEPIPEDLFAGQDFMQVDSSAMESDEAFLEEGFIVPLTPVEELAYASIDSSMSLIDAYEPGGALGRAIQRQREIEDRRERLGGGFGQLLGNLPEPRLWYNRVDGFHVGAQYDRDIFSAVTLRGGGGYSTGLTDENRWSYDVSARLTRGGYVANYRASGFVKLGYRAHNAMRYGSRFHFRGVNSLSTLLGKEDYFDYYRSKGPYMTANLNIRQWPAEIEVTWRDEDHMSLPLTTSYDIRGIKTPQRSNAAVDEGRMHTLTLRTAVGDRVQLPGIVGSRNLELTTEHTLPGSNFKFRRHYVTGQWRMTTFGARRFLPATLDIIGTVGFTSGGGRLPPQRVFILEGGRSSYAPFGALRSLKGLPREGRQMVSLVWDHNFRTIPFEILDLYGLVEKGYNLLIYGGHAWLWDEFEDGTLAFQSRHQELGISLSGIFGLLRLDFAKDLESRSFSIGFGIAQLL